MLAPQMVGTCGESFETYRRVIIDPAMGDSVVCSLDNNRSLQGFFIDINITLKPMQYIIIEALGEFRHNSEKALVALEASGSPFNYNAIEALRT